MTVLPDDTDVFIIRENLDPDLILTELGLPGPPGVPGPQGEKGDTGTVGDLNAVAPLSYDEPSNTLIIDQTAFDAAGSATLAAANALAQANAFSVAQKAARAYTYAQQTASQTWVVTHNLGTRPAVVVVDTANQEIFGDITYSDNNSVVISFTSPFSGTAYLI